VCSCTFVVCVVDSRSWGRCAANRRRTAWSKGKSPDMYLNRAQAQLCGSMDLRNRLGFLVRN
jgi:hypothetical protein